MLLQDEDTKSSCSTITRFLKQALPEVLPQPANPSRDGNFSKHSPIRRLVKAY